MKYINCKFRLLLLAAGILLFGLSSCLGMFDSDGDADPNDCPPAYIALKNNTQCAVAIIMVPTDLPDNLLNNPKYSTTTEIRSGETGKCFYFISYDGYFFSTGEELDVIAVDVDIYSQYDVMDIVLNPDLQMTHSVLDKTGLLETGSLGRLNQNDNQFELIWGL